MWFPELQPYKKKKKNTMNEIKRKEFPNSYLLIKFFPLQQPYVIAATFTSLFLLLTFLQT